MNSHVVGWMLPRMRGSRNSGRNNKLLRSLERSSSKSSYTYTLKQVCNPTRDLECTDELKEVVFERVCSIEEIEECKDVEELECEPTFKEECSAVPSTTCNVVTKQLCETEER